MQKRMLDMGTELLSIVCAAKHEIVEKNAQSQRHGKEQRQKKRKDAEYAFEVFHSTLSCLLGIKTFRIGISALTSKKDCVIIEDSLGRKFEIHYEKAIFIDGSHFGGGNCDYHINAQWSTNTWYQYSTGMSEAEVAKHLGRWLAETEIANSLKCK